jgi:hypothetical protein
VSAEAKEILAIAIFGITYLLQRPAVEGAAADSGHDSDHHRRHGHFIVDELTTDGHG